VIDLERILRECEQNNREAQKELFEHYADKMTAVCMRYIKNKEDVKDVLQEGFMKVFDGIGSFQGNAKFDTWMTRIFINLSINKVTRGRAKYHFVDLDQTAEIADDSSIEVDHDLDANYVMKRMSELPEKYRIVLNMYAVDGFSHKEISQKLGITVGGSKSRLSRARTMLMDKLKK
jgi:RNA polymerase sigma factor (sigma-70 family)